MRSRVNLDWKGEQATREMANAGVEGIEASAEDLLKRSQELCPKDRGWDGGLVTSGRIETDAGEQAARVVYGGPGFMHAALQHEKMNYKHDDGESAKYVEKPFNEQADSYMKLVADRIRQVIGN